MSDGPMKFLQRRKLRKLYAARKEASDAERLAVLSRNTQSINRARRRTQEALHSAMRLENKL